MQKVRKLLCLLLCAAMLMSMSAVCFAANNKYSSWFKTNYDEINQLEKSKIEVMEHISYHELFLTWALAALGLLFAESLLSNLVLKRIP